ncbi:MAG: hypothetical protein V1707_01895 [bacterium]
MKLKNYAVATLLTLAITAPMVVLAQIPTNFGTDATDFGLVTDTDLKAAVINMIKAVLGLLGLVAVVIVMMGGFKWMTAQGDATKLGAAKKLIYAGLIGLVIILLAYSITQFVVTFITTQAIT